VLWEVLLGVVVKRWGGAKLFKNNQCFILFKVSYNGSSLMLGKSMLSH
jgi:hypothetical protein